ncbi:MAG: ArsR family transcriptional regulator, partial [Ilumatobacteraceae bacterium]
MSTDAELPPAVLSVIADPHRWRLLRELGRSDRRVGELTELIGAPQNLVSYHLAELRNAGLV